MTALRHHQMTPSSLERVRVRARLLDRGVTIRAVAQESGRTEGFVSRVLARRRNAMTEGGQDVVRAAERLSGLTWAELIAPMTRRRVA